VLLGGILNVQMFLNYESSCGNKDATDEFLLQILLLAQYVSGTIMPIIRSSRILYKWFPPVVFGAVKMEIVNF
jgi:hypothetical protein